MRSQLQRALPLAALVAACTSDQGPVAPAGAGPASTATPKEHVEKSQGAQDRTTASNGLVLSPQAGWIDEKPASAMRKAQYRLPRAEGDGEDASLVVYYFGGQGGSKEANLERWAGQFEQPDGRRSGDVMQHLTRKVEGLDVLDVDLSGTYVAETSPGSGERVRKPEWRMLASIVESPVESAEGPWYVKLVGPAATVAKWEASYRAFVSTIRPAR